MELTAGPELQQGGHVAALLSHLIGDCDYEALPILNMVVPQTGHLPFVAGLPFFMVVASAFCISRWVRHLRQ